MNIKKHHKDIIILNKIINNLITEKVKEDLSGYSNQELMDKAYAGLKKSLSAQKSQLSQFKEIEVDIEQPGTKGITSQVWTKLGDGNRIRIQFDDTIDDLEIPPSMGNSEKFTKISSTIHELTAHSFNDNNYILFAKSSGKFMPGSIKDVLMSFKRSAEATKPNEGTISVYDTSNNQYGASKRWVGKITQYVS